MLQGFGLEEVFYCFDWGVKISFFALIPLAIFIFWHLKKSHFSMINSWLIFLIILFLDLLIFYSYDMIFGTWLGLFMSLLILLLIWDFKTLSVPVWLNVLCLFVGTFGIIFRDSIVMSVVEGFGLCGVLGFVQVVCRLFGKEALGDGDVMIALPLGFVFGFFGGLDLLFIAGLLGLLLFLITRSPALPLVSLLVGAVGVDFVLGIFNV